jgi:fatty-acyl-CoA synthase
VITGKPTPENLLPLLGAAPHQLVLRAATVWIALLRSPLFDTTDLSSLRKGYYGASIMPVAVLQGDPRACRRCAVELLRPDRDRAAGHRAQARRPIAQGRLGRQAGDQCRDPGGRRPDERRQSPARSARSCTARPQLLTGLLPRPERTAAAFEGGWFHSGDLATIDDEGYITVVDRKKDMIKTGGENVASREVEEMVYRWTASARWRWSACRTRAGSRP